MTENEAPTPHPYWRGAAAFAIVVGGLMLLLWLYQILAGMPELDVQPLSTWFHVFGQVVTAALLLVAGLALIRQKSWSRKLYLIAIGALLLSIINAIAFYSERGDIALVIAFIVLAVLGVFFAIRAEE